MIGTIVDDAFLTKEKQQEIYNLLISSGNFEWFLNLKTNNFLNKKNDTFQFTHSFFIDNEAISPHYNLIMNIFNEFLNKHDLKCTKIIRAKANLVTKNMDINHLEPHIDTDIPHKVFLYYVNNSDGSTVFYKDPVNLSMPIRSELDLEVGEEVLPLMGRAINFDGLTYHSASSPKNNDFRVVINITYLDY